MNDCSFVVYFSGKDELITELFKELESKIIATIREGFPTEGAIRERFLVDNHLPDTLNSL